MLLLITVLHLFTPPDDRRRTAPPALPASLLHSDHLRRIRLRKAWRCITALLAAIPFAIHAQMSLRFPLGLGFDNWIEIASFFVVGLLFGAIRDIEERRAEDLQQVSTQLEDAYKKLEERAIQLINIQDYTQSILRSITSGVLTVGPDGSVATANPAAERMLGLSEFEMVPRPIGSLFRSDGGHLRRRGQGALGPTAARDARVHAADDQRSRGPRPGRPHRACGRSAARCSAPS